MDPSKLLNKLLEIRNQMKLYHWQTESYARHKAADKFLGKAEDLIDRIIESYQGKYGTINVKNNTNKIELVNIKDDDIVKYLKLVKEFLIKDYPKFITENENTDLLNLRDEFLENINRTLYLFKLE